MHRQRVLSVVVLVSVILSMLLTGNGAALAQPAPSDAANRSMAPISPTDETKVPHYFGPYPNWANSPVTSPAATVTINGIGSGAEAVATVGANGAVTGITVTKPGSGYDTTATVTIGGAGAGALATPTVTLTGIVTEIVVDTPGAGYTAPVVTIGSVNGGGATTQATATAFGHVDSLTLTNTGSGYTFPTVDFDWPDDPNGVLATGHVDWNQLTGRVTAIFIDNPGSGYAKAPHVVIRDGTLNSPINNRAAKALEARAESLNSRADGVFAATDLVNPEAINVVDATAVATISIDAIMPDTFGAGYTSAPDVKITNPVAVTTQAVAHALTDRGGVTAINVTAAGAGYLTPGGIRKFVDTLPGLGATATNNLGQYIPVGVPDTTTFANADYYEIAVVEYQEKMHSDLPPTTLRGYVQVETAKITGAHYPLPGGKFGVTAPHYLGPTLIATKDRAVRITFYNLLPTGANGDLFLPVDTTMMGSGEGQMDMPYDPAPTTGGTVMDDVRNPMCTEKYYNPMMRSMCFTENRATLHLHGGTTPWISDGTVHQWITPAGESTMWPQGVSVADVPDMVGASRPAGVPDCSGANDGCQTFYYTNQQSARLLFYHDHSWGITRLNVYAGEAAGYLITDPTEQKLMAAGGPLADVSYGIPLVVQDRTFVPDAAQLALQDPTWDVARWGSKGSFWYHHVYMPAQNPGDPGGMSGYGRWMYGPWFWPPAGETKYGPIANPYYNPTCSLDDPATWTYQTDPFCEPQLIPGTPNISVGMEQFNDTPLVNGTAYPTVTLDPKTYRFRILNAANDRFFNFQWYVADPTTASTGLNAMGQVIGGTEVALDPALVAAAQTDPVVFPTPIHNAATEGPDWVQIGTEGGFLPAPVVVDGQQETTWITDPTRFDVGNVDLHSLLLAPAERADVLVDFSKFAGKTLILYNDAPAAFPARVPSYDYYTGYPDQWPIGPSAILPGYGPNTRTIMQVKIAATTPAPAYNVNALKSAFTHKADGSGVFESGQHPIIVGQAPYNSAYGKSFASASWCNAPTNPATKCDGYFRVSEQGGTLWKFDTLKGAQLAVKVEPKAIHDEMNASTFDEFGRMQANLGLEAVPATPGLQNINLMPFVFPTTEIIDGTNLPKANIKVTPIASASDGTQIWRFTHNGVDTHPIHFHLFDVQVLNRVTWDNIIIPPDATELGWKDTVRISPLEDTIVALRPVVPQAPFDIPNSIRTLSPMMPDGQPIMLASVIDTVGGGVPPTNGNGELIDVYNHYINYGWEYVYHCHILSHEEMDMMRPVSLALPPVAPSNLAVTGPTGSGASRHIDLSWRDNSRSETAWEVQRSPNGADGWTVIATLPTAPTLTKTTGQSTGGTVTYSDVIGTTALPLYYRVLAVNVVGDTWDYADPAINEIVSGGFPTVSPKSLPSNVATPAGPAIPAAPSNATVTATRATIRNDLVTLTWTDNATNETGFTIQRATNAAFTANLNTSTVGANVTTLQQTQNRNVTLYYRIRANNGTVSSAWVNFTPFPVVTP